MTKQADGSYTWTASNVPAGSYSVQIIFNKSWDPKAYDKSFTTLDKGTITVKYVPNADTKEKGTTTLTYPDKAPAGTTPVVQKASITMHVKLDSSVNWKSVGLYACSAPSWTEKVTGEWPGFKMTADSKNAGWYGVAYAGTATSWNVILNNLVSDTEKSDANPKYQSSNIEGLANGEYWFTLAKNAEGKYVATKLDAAPTGWVDSPISVSTIGQTTTTTPATSTNPKTSVENVVMPIAIIAILACGTVFASKKLKKD